VTPDPETTAGIAVTGSSCLLFIPEIKKAIAIASAKRLIIRLKFVFVFIK